MPRNGLLVVGGPPKSYKSFMLLNLAVHIALGTNMYGAYRTHARTSKEAFTVPKPRKVLIFEQELGEERVQKRLRSLVSLATAEEMKLLSENLHVHCRDHTLRLDEDFGRFRVKTVVEKVRPEVVMFDPLFKFHLANEISSQEVGKVLRNLDILRNEWDFATVLSHHTRKSRVDGISASDEPEELRGTNALFADGDAFMMLRVTNRAAGQVRISFTVRDGAPISNMVVRLDWQDMRVKFHEWSRSRTKEEEDMDRMFEHSQRPV